MSPSENWLLCYREFFLTNPERCNEWNPWSPNPALSINPDLQRGLFILECTNTDHFSKYNNCLKLALNWNMAKWIIIFDFHQRAGTNYNSDLFRCGSVDGDVKPYSLTHSDVVHVVYARVMSSFSLDFSQCLSLVSGEDRQPQFLFQRISVTIQRFNAVLLHDGFCHPTTRINVCFNIL